MIRIMINDPATDTMYTELFDRERLKHDSFYRMEFNYSILRMESKLMSVLKEEVKREGKKP